MPSSTRSMASIGSRVRTGLPWLIGLTLLAVLMRRYVDPAERAYLWEALVRAPSWAIFVAGAGAVAGFFGDTLATWLAFRWNGVSLRMREVGIIRGMTYFFAMVNYNLGQVAMIVVLARAGVRAARATGIILFIMGINVIVLLALASLSIAFGAPAPPLLRQILLVAALSLPVYALILLARPRLLADRALLAPLFELGPIGHGKAVLARLPHVLSMMISQWMIMRCFGIHATLLEGILYLPIVYAVAVLPISAQGIGTSQLMLMQFFGPFAKGDPSVQHAAIMAYSLYVMVAWLLVQLLIGLLCVRTPYGRTLRGVVASAAAEKADTPAVDASKSI